MKPTKPLVSLAAAIPLFVMILLVGCGGDDGTTPDPDPSYTLVGETDIGVTGGDLATDDFLLSVPAGAFTEDATVALYRSDDDVLHDTGQISPTYRLEGLPETWTSPLRFAIRYEDVLEDENALAVRRPAFNPAQDEEDLYLTWETASDSSGYLVGYVPAGATGKSAGDPYDLAAAVFSYMELRQTAHFNLRWVKFDTAAQVDSVAAYLEAAANRFEQMGFDLATLLQGPPSAFVCTLGDGNGGHVIVPRRATLDRPVHMEFATPKAGVTDYADLRRLVTRTVFEIVPLRHVRQGSWVKNAWLTHATEAWSETLAAGWADHLPSDFAGHEGEPLRGLQGGGSTDVVLHREHGFGMLPLIHHLVDQYGEAVVFRIFDTIKTLDSWPVRSIDESIEEEVNEWWPAFMKRYIAGDLCGVTADQLMAHREGTFIVDSENDRHATFEASYVDVSANLYVVDLGYPGFAANDSIRFTVTSGSVAPEDLQLQLFKLQDGDLEFLTEAGASLTVADVAGMTQQGWDLVAVVVNSDHGIPPNKSRTDITLQIDITDAPDALPYLYFEFETFVLADYAYSTGGSSSSTGTFYLDGRGTFSGNTFQGAWHDLPDGENLRSGYVTIVLDLQAQAVTSFAMADTLQMGDDRVIIEAAGAGLTAPEVGSHYLYYDEQGEVVASHLSHLYWRSEYDGGWSELSAYGASSYSTLELKLDEWYLKR